MPLALLLLLLVGGGATGVVAEKSLPGDVLYPVKIHINENFESAIAFTAKSDAEVSVKQAARRLAEAEQLKEKGKLSAEQSEELKDAFNAEVKSVKENVSKVRSKGDTKSADEIDSKFENNIKEHSEIVVTLGVRDEDSDDENESGAKVESKVKAPENSIRKEDDGDDEDGEDEVKKVVTPVKVVPKVVTPPKPTTPTTPTTPVSTVKKYTMEQIATHNTPTDCWAAVNGGVYNLTNWIAEHPGGQFPIISMCGKDGTTMFLNAHGGQGDPARELATLKIGDLQ
jgi:cytochrome b involved in lipid metabolism